MKKILQIVIIVLSIFWTKSVFSFENPNYKFLGGGHPSFVNLPYDLSFSRDDKSISLTGSIYATYNDDMINYLSFYHPLKKESGYLGLAGWNGVIFVEPKRLKEGVNKIMWSDYYGYMDYDYITSEDKSMFGVDIICGAGGDCTLSSYAGLDWYFSPLYEGNLSEHYKGRNLNWGKRTIVKNFSINRETSPDFLIFVSIEYSQKQSKMNEGRIKLDIDVETTPGSGKMRKPTETTKITGFFPSYISKNTGFRNDSIKLKFFDHNNTFSISHSLISNDLYKMSNVFSMDSHYNIFEDYYRSMSLLTYEYLLQNGLKVERPSREEIDNHIGDDGNPWNNNDTKNDEFVYRDCETTDVGCHISNLGTTISGTISGFMTGVKNFLQNIWNGFFEIVQKIMLWLGEKITNFFSAIYEKYLKFFVDLFINNAKPIFDYIKTFFGYILDIITGKVTFSNFMWGNQEYFCSKKSNFFIEDTTATGKKPIESIGLLLYFINPIPPVDGSQICTSDGLKTINYGRDTIIDTIVFNIFVFAGIWFMFLFLRKYS